MLDRLQTRCQGDFPHEIDVFLGYPCEDVRGFIRHGGQGYKLCGYWKVYGDPREGTGNLWPHGCGATPGGPTVVKFSAAVNGGGAHRKGCVT